MARPTGRSVRDELIEAAQRRIQEVGVDALSYGDLAAELGIRAPSIHHHFRRKDDLVAAVTRSYREAFGERVAQIDTASSLAAISAYAELFAETAEHELLCLCGAVAADWRVAGDESRAEVALFFSEQSEWLVNRLQGGMTAGELAGDLDPHGLAVLLLSALEGSMLLKRSGVTIDPSRTVARHIDHLLRTDRERRGN